MVRIQGKTEQDGGRFHQAAQNSMQLKKYELFTSGIIHLLLSDRS